MKRLKEDALVAKSNFKCPICRLTVTYRETLNSISRKKYEK